MLFGSISPMVINLLTEEAKDSGKSSGTVYAVSTFGGILTTFFVGFYSLPQFGLPITLFFYGFLVIATALLLFVYSKKLNAAAIIVILLSISSYAFNRQLDKETYLYKSEGILGEVKVIDEVLYNAVERKNKAYRKLMVNNISQTIMDIQNPEQSYWDYVKMIVYNINSYAKNKEALLLGMGGGTILKQLKNNGFEVDVVEIDARMKNVAHQFFGVSKDHSIYIDDARHYIKTSPQKYDAIVYDLYNSETPPVHLMTKEAFSEIYALLNKEGVLAINFYGFTEGSRGKAARSIFKTLQSENFNIQLMATAGEEQYRNLLFLCSPGKLKATLPEKHLIIPQNSLDLDDAVILTDEIPALEHLYLEAAISWRTNYNKANFAKIMQAN
jgi:predicted membrane-bound spermidine synthase